MRFLDKIFWNYLRPAYLWLFRFGIRVLGRISPKAVYFLDQISKDLAGEIKRNPCVTANEVCLTVDGIEFKLDISEAAVSVKAEYNSLAVMKVVYEPVMTKCLTQILNRIERPIFMDLGSYMGYYACYVAALQCDKEKVYAVESNPAYCESIRRSISLNNFSNIEIYNTVLSNTVEKVDIKNETVNFGKAGESGTTTTTLDELCSKESLQPNVIKMDVHGTEGKILFGMERLMKGSLQFMLLELHPYHYLEKYSPGITRTDILAFADKLGFNIFYIAGHRIATSQKSRECIRTGRFAYRRIQPDTNDPLLFDRQGEIFLLLSKEGDIATVLGDSITDPFLC